MATNQPTQKAPEFPPFSLASQPHALCASGREEDVRILLNHYAQPPEEQDNDGRTLIHHAVWFNQTGILDLLFEKCTLTSLNIQDNYGNTALYYAIYRDDLKYTKIIISLVRRGASPDVPNKLHRTPRQLLYSNGSVLQTCLDISRVITPDAALAATGAKATISLTSSAVLSAARNAQNRATGGFVGKARIAQAAKADECLRDARTVFHLLRHHGPNVAIPGIPQMNAAGATANRMMSLRTPTADTPKPTTPALNNKSVTPANLGSMTGFAPLSNPPTANGQGSIPPQGLTRKTSGKDRNSRSGSVSLAVPSSATGASMSSPISPMSPISPLLPHPLLSQKSTSSEASSTRDSSTHLEITVANPATGNSIPPASSAKEQHLSAPNMSPNPSHATNTSANTSANSHPTANTDGTSSAAPNLSASLSRGSLATPARTTATPAKKPAHAASFVNLVDDNLNQQPQIPFLHPYSYPYTTATGFTPFSFAFIPPPPPELSPAVTDSIIRDVQRQTQSPIRSTSRSASPQRSRSPLKYASLREPSERRLDSPQRDRPALQRPQTSPGFSLYGGRTGGRGVTPNKDGPARSSSSRLVQSGNSKKPISGIPFPSLHLDTPSRPNSTAHSASLSMQPLAAAPLSVDTESNADTSPHAILAPLTSPRAPLTAIRPSLSSPRAKAYATVHGSTYLATMAPYAPSAQPVPPHFMSPKASSHGGNSLNSGGHQAASGAHTTSPSPSSRKNPTHTRTNSQLGASEAPNPGGTTDNTMPITAGAVAVLSSASVRGVISSIENIVASNDDCEMLLAQVDIGMDGRVDLEDFWASLLPRVGCLSGLPAAGLSATVDPVFDFLDVDGDGIITVQDIMAAKLKLGGVLFVDNETEARRLIDCISSFYYSYKSDVVGSITSHDGGAAYVQWLSSIDARNKEKQQQEEKEAKASRKHDKHGAEDHDAPDSRGKSSRRNSKFFPGHPSHSHHSKTPESTTSSMHRRLSKDHAAHHRDDQPADTRDDESEDINSLKLFTDRMPPLFQEDYAAAVRVSAGISRDMMLCVASGLLDVAVTARQKQAIQEGIQREKEREHRNVMSRPGSAANSSLRLSGSSSSSLRLSANTSSPHLMTRRLSVISSSGSSQRLAPSGSSSTAELQRVPSTMLFPTAAQTTASQQQPQPQTQTAQQQLQALPPPVVSFPNEVVVSPPASSPGQATPARPPSTSRPTTARPHLRTRSGTVIQPSIGAQSTTSAQPNVPGFPMAAIAAMNSPPVSVAASPTPLTDPLPRSVLPPSGGSRPVTSRGAVRPSTSSVVSADANQRRLVSSSRSSDALVQQTVMQPRSQPSQSRDAQSAQTTPVLGKSTLVSVTEGTGSDEGGFEGMGEGGIESVRLDDEIQWAKEDYDRQDEWERERQRDEFAMKMAGHMPDGHLHHYNPIGSRTSVITPRVESAGSSRR